MRSLGLIVCLAACDSAEPLDPGMFGPPVLVRGPAPEPVMPAEALEFAGTGSWRPPRPCVETALATAPRTAIRLAEVRDLEVDVTFAAGCPAESVTIELVSPQGKTYEVRRASAQQGHAALSIPVAGSAIALRGLAGRWTVRTLLGGQLAHETGLELPR